MTIKAGRKRSRVPRAPLPPSSRPPTAIELWYLDCFRRLRDHLAADKDRPISAPSIVELAAYCERSTFPAYAAMRSLERKGLVRRDAAQSARFVLTDAGENAIRVTA